MAMRGLADWRSRTVLFSGDAARQVILASLEAEPGQAIIRLRPVVTSQVRNHLNEALGNCVVQDNTRNLRPATGRLVRIVLEICRRQAPLMVPHKSFGWLGYCDVFLNLANRLSVAGPSVKNPDRKTRKCLPSMAQQRSSRRTGWAQPAMLAYRHEVRNILQAIELESLPPGLWKAISGSPNAG